MRVLRLREINEICSFPRTEIVNYFEPGKLPNSLILCDMTTRNKKFMNNPG